MNEPEFTRPADLTTSSGPSGLLIKREHLNCNAQRCSFYYLGGCGRGTLPTIDNRGCCSNYEED